MFKMTTNILRNLAGRKSTRLYPRDVRETFDRVRGELLNDIQRCLFCGTCAVKCPSQCIAVERKAAMWTYDPFACVYCGVCVETCPAKSLHQKTLYRKPTTERVVVRMQGELKKRVKGASPEKDAPAASDA
ncbi:MAG: 4Fe-4S binding protein [Desulfobacterales bacterium]|jgi:ech hydrogenase subunit F|nr:4Fe-4S binding protein [Desulfobacterales bacterium]MCU0561727.1 4Fe-4S binding protein [Desulfobacterales bacterium]